jgi:hypothetical protein
MILKNKYLHTNFSDLEISSFRFYSGLIVGFLTSIAYYGFLYGLREAFRIFTISEEYDIWILSDAEVSFYNMFFAFIAVIYGHSVCISHWLETPRRWKDRIYRRRFSIINDFRGNSWIFISWFVRITTLLGFLYCFTFKYWHYAYQLYPRYRFLLILFAVVLFLNTWNSTRLIFKNRSFKWFFYTLLITVGLSFGLSKINPIDYKSINSRVLNKSVYHNYNLQIPRTDFQELLYNQSLVWSIYIAESKVNRDSSVIWTDGEKIKLEDIRGKVSEWREMLFEADQPRMTIRLTIHSGTKMRIVNQVKEELSRSFALRIAYAVAPIDSDLDPRFFRNHSIISKLPPPSVPFFDSEEYINSINSHKNPIVINHTDYQDSISYNGLFIHIDNLTDSLKTEILANPKYLIKYYFKDTLEYENYITIISNAKLCIEELRDSYSLEHYSLKFDDLYWHDLYWEKASEVNRLFQYRLLEINEDFAKKLDR